ncbi:hypothetical protein, partial [Treponema sp.]|uniref:hypothetical protein n=1 Tax=Treponema sp. TaxID=166 RepID=UPI0025D08831
MKKSLSISALVLIFLAELAGLLGILYLRSSMDFQSSLFNSMVENVFKVESDVEHLKSLLYKYEYNMSLIMDPSDERNSDTLRELTETELEIRNQLMVHGNILKNMKKGSEKEVLFRSV